MLTCNMRIKRFLLLLCLLWAPFIMIHAQKAYRFESIPSWVDNFSRFDSTVWDRWTGYTGNELETYTKSERNAYIKNGKLVIRALEENVNSKKCTSARICCLNNKSFLYGKISVRARIPLVTVMFPAIWMLPQASIFTPEPYGEIDLMEYIPCWKKNAFQCNVHIVTKPNGKDHRDQYAKTLDLRNVEFVGKTSEPQKYYRRAKFFLMTSRYEGFPMTIIEAMQFGCIPIVYNSFSAINDIIDSGKNGMLVSNGDEKQFEQVMRELVAKENRQNVIRKQLRPSLDKFSRKIILDSWNNLFKTLISKTSL